MANFINDEEKMSDFKLLPKVEFLNSYSYITEEEYEATSNIYFDYLDTIKMRLQEHYDENQTYYRDMPKELKLFVDSCWHIVGQQIWVDDEEDS